MEHFDITFIELYNILSAASATLKEWIRLFKDDEINEKDKQTLAKADELRKFIMKCPSSFFKIVEDEPF